MSSTPKQRFLFIEETDGGMELMTLDSVSEFERIPGWMEGSCLQSDVDLLTWAYNAKVGDYYLKHRLGIVIRVTV